MTTSKTVSIILAMNPVNAPLVRACDDCKHPHGLFVHTKNSTVRCLDCHCKGINKDAAAGRCDPVLVNGQPIGTPVHCEHIYPGILKVELKDPDMNYFEKQADSLNSTAQPKRGS